MSAIASLSHGCAGLMDEPRTRIDLRSEPEFRERIEAQAERYGLTLSAYIRLAVTRQLEKDEADTPPPRAKRKKS